MRLARALVSSHSSLGHIVVYVGVDSAEETILLRTLKVIGNMQVAPVSYWSNAYDIRESHRQVASRALTWHPDEESYLLILKQITTITSPKARQYQEVVVDSARNVNDESMTARAAH